MTYQLELKLPIRLTLTHFKPIFSIYILRKHQKRGHRKGTKVNNNIESYWYF